MAQDLTPMQHFVLGGAMSSLSTTVSTPIQNAKSIHQSRNTILQSDIYNNNSIPSYLLNHDWTHTLLQNIAKDKGITALFAGNLFNIVRSFPSSALDFALQNAINSMFPTSSDSITIAKRIISGSIAGALSLSIVYPFDAMNQRNILYFYYNQEDNMNKQKQKKNKLSNYYSGFPISIAGLIIYRALHSILHHAFKPMVKSEDKVQGFIVGFGVTLVSGLVTFPLDTVRKRQLITGENIMDAFAGLVKRNGIIVLWNGAMEGVIQGVLGGLVWVSFSAIKERLLNNSKCT
eukprot:169115_1